MIAPKILTHLSKDTPLKKLIASIQLDYKLSGLPISQHLYRSIISQQLSVKAASTIYGRFLELFKTEKQLSKKVLALSIEQLRAVGLSRQKAVYVQNVAQFEIDHKIDQIDWENKTDEEIIQLLTQIKGVGVWTVQMVLMFNLGRKDVFPINDLGIQQAIVNLYNVKEEGKAQKAKLIKISNKWAPYRSIACLYLWRWKDQ